MVISGGADWGYCLFHKRYIANNCNFHCSCLWVVGRNRLAWFFTTTIISFAKIYWNTNNRCFVVCMAFELWFNLCKPYVFLDLIARKLGYWIGGQENEFALSCSSVPLLEQFFGTLDLQKAIILAILVTIWVLSIVYRNKFNKQSNNVASLG